MDSPSQQSAVQRKQPFQPVGRAGYIVTNEMYSTLYNLYYQRCSRHRLPCLVVVRHGSHCRLDLDMTCSNHELTDWARRGLESMFRDVAVDELYSDDVYFWATRVPNRLSDRLARGILNLLCDERASLPA